MSPPAGDDAVLKVTPPERRLGEPTRRPTRSSTVGGRRRRRGCCAATGRGARFLIERARPGDDIAGLPDEEATAIAVDVGSAAVAAGGAPFRWVGDRVPRWLDKAEGHELRAARGGAATRGIELRHDVLVHGDFHHHNILASARGHLAIDPQPFLGEPEYDVVPFLWNPLPIGMRPELTRRAARRVRRGRARRGADRACGR